MPRVSIIMPVYNGERFIAEAIESVLAQTLQDWELIIVDDGSTDSTPTVLAEFGDPRIVKIRQTNGGAAAARNAALAVATGEYVGFLDADDLYLPSALDDLGEYLVTSPDLDVVYSDGLMCDADKNPIMRLTEIRPGIYTGWILEQVVLSASVITVPVCTLTRRATIAGCDVSFDANLAPSEDYDFWIQMARCGQFGYLDKLTCMYRIHETNITKTSGSERRSADLIRGRLKVLNSEWFEELSAVTRHKFFHNLLVGLMGNDTEQQHAVMQTFAFQSLPPADQSDILRLVAGNHLSQRQNTEFALQCLHQSLALQPGNPKTHLLLKLANYRPSLAVATLSAWRVIHNTQVRVQSLGHRRAKPVPAALLPAAD